MPLAAALLAAISSAASAQDDAARGKLKAAACVSCHGADGNASAANTPSLAAQPEMYLQLQLVLFREMQRIVPEKTAVVAKLSDTAIEDIAAYFTAQPAKPANTERDPVRSAQGRELGERMHCNDCHTPSYAGANQVPRLAGQREDYLVKSMKDYRDGRRRGLDGSKRATLRGMSDEQIEALAHFLSLLK